MITVFAQQKYQQGLKQKLTRWAVGWGQTGKCPHAKFTLSETERFKTRSYKEMKRKKFRKNFLQDKTLTPFLP